MPGIVTLFDPHGRPDLPVRFRRMQQATQLKPGYLCDSRAEDRVAVGRTDLGIFNAGPQPVASQDGRYWLCFQGELYDVVEKLRRLKDRGIPLTGDDSPDLLLATFLADGLAGIERLNGSFFFVLWDRREQRLIAGSDRYASRPHFYACDGDRFLLAPNMQAILAAMDGLPPYRWEGIFEFLALEYPLADHTFFAGVHAFPGGTFLLLSPGETRWLPYWTVRYEAPDVPTAACPEPVLDMATHLYRQAVARRMPGPIGIPLSGGLDSRLILAFATRRDVPVLTMGDAESDDVRFARLLAQALGYEHVVYDLPPDYLTANAQATIALGDGMSSLFHAHNSGTADGPPIELNGMYSEFSRIYPVEAILAEAAHSPGHRLALWTRQARTGRIPLATVGGDAALVDRLLPVIWSIIPPGLAQEVLQAEATRAMGETVTRSVTTELARIRAGSKADRIAAFILLQRQRRFTQWGLKQANAHGEFRTPLADYDLVDFLLTLPAGTRRNLQAQVIRRAAPQLADVPLTPTGIPLDASRLRRGAAYGRLQLSRRLHPGRRQTFSDPQQALRTHAAAFYQEVLLDPAALGNGLFRPEGIRRLLASHMAGQANQASAICALATFELWRRTYGTAPARTVVG